MSLSRGYNLTPSALEHVQLLDWIYDHGGDRPGHAVRVGSRFEDISHEEGVSLRARLRALESSGSIAYEPMMGWTSDSCVMTSQGLALVEETRATRQDLRIRYIAVQDALLAWLYTSARQGTRSPQLDDFHSSPYGNFYGDPITQDEVSQATRRLLSDGYISGGPTFGGGVSRPVISGNGEHLVEQGRSIGDSRDAPAGSIYNTTVNHSTGVTVAQGSPGAQQTATVTITQETADKVALVADKLTALLPELPEERRAEAADLVDDLRDALATPEPRPGVLRRKLTRVVGLLGTGLVTGAATATSAEAVALASDVIGQLAG